MQVLPHTGVWPIVKHYLFLENASMAAGQIRLFADGHTGIVFLPEKQLIAGIDSKGLPVSLPESFLHGQISRHKDILIPNGLRIVIAVLQPAGATLLTGVPATHLKEHIIDAAALLGSDAACLHDQLKKTAISNSQKCQLLNSFFAKLMTRHLHPEQWLINASLQYIYSGKGLHSIAQLVKHTGYTERHLNRKFNEWVGLSPKTYSNIVQLHYFLKLLKNAAPGTSYTSLGYDAGYADQSHLIKSFKKITGITPTAYTRKTQQLAVNLIRPLAAAVRQ